MHFMLPSHAHGFSKVIMMKSCFPKCIVNVQCYLAGSILIHNPIKGYKNKPASMAYKTRLDLEK